MAVGLEGEILTTTDPSGGAGAWKVAHLSEPLGLRSVSGASKSLCVAGDTNGDVISSTEPTDGAEAWSVVPQVGGLSSILGLSCNGAGLCAAGSAGYVLTSTSPNGGTSAWASTPLTSRFQILAMSVPRPRFGRCDNEQRGSCRFQRSDWWILCLVHGPDHLPCIRMRYLESPAPRNLSVSGAASSASSLLRPIRGPKSAPIVPVQPSPPGTQLVHNPPHIVRFGRHRRTVETGFRFRLNRARYCFSMQPRRQAV